MALLSAALIGLMALGMSAPSGAGVDPRLAHEHGVHPSADVAAALGVRAVSLQRFPVGVRAQEITRVSVALGEERVHLDIEPWNLRAEGFRLVLDLGEGDLLEREPEAPSTVRGVIRGEPGSVVAGSLNGGHASLMIIRASGEVWGVQPAGEVFDEVHAVYRADEILPMDLGCGVGHARKDLIPELGPAGHDASNGAGTPRGSGGLRLAEIAFDADFPLFASHSMNETRVLADLEAILAATTAIYERDVSLTYRLTRVILRTTSDADPYSASSGGDLLSQFRSHWNSNHNGVPRDLAHLMSGRNFDGSTIGVAYVGTVCGSSAYGVNQIRFSSNFNSRVALFAHEAGHNWDASHCNSDSECRIMCSGLGGCSGIGSPVRFAEGPIGEITSFSERRGCLDPVAQDLPFIDQFAVGQIQPTMWPVAEGVGIESGFDLPSRFFAAAISPGGRLESVQLDLDTPSGSGVGLRFWARGEPGSEPLLAEYRFQNTIWLPIGRVPSPTSEGYEPFAIRLPDQALADGTAIRFRTTSDSAVWGIDDIEIDLTQGPASPVPLPFIEQFETGGLSMDRWQLGGSVRGGNPANGEFSLEIASREGAETADLLAASESEPIVLGAFVAPSGNVGEDGELVVEFRDDRNRWHAAFVIGSDAGSAFRLYETVLPVGAHHDGLRVRLRAVGDGVWRVDDLEVGGEPRQMGCLADVAEPFGVLDLTDIATFVDAFVGQGANADLNSDGLFDLGDVTLFVDAFVSGCPGL